MSHKTVFIRGCDGAIDPFALLKATEHAVFVCKEDAYDDIVCGRRSPPLLGFPIEDAFELDGEPSVGNFETSHDRLKAFTYDQA